MTNFLPPFDDEPFKAPQDVPVFPLSRVVLLPGEPMPLHIFEERYRVMMESAISTERLIALAHVKPGPEVVNAPPDKIYEICGLGRIVVDERLEDGRFNLILLGLRRVRIKQFIQERPYKRARIEVLSDHFSQTSSSVLSALSADIVHLTQTLISERRKSGLNSESQEAILEQLPGETLPLGTLCDLLAAALGLPPLEKQMIMEETDVVRRAEMLLFYLRFEIQSFTYASQHQPRAIH